jgi:hypothetical protein
MLLFGKKPAASTVVARITGRIGPLHLPVSSVTAPSFITFDLIESAEARISLVLG